MERERAREKLESPENLDQNYLEIQFFNEVSLVEEARVTTATTGLVIVVVVVVIVVLRVRIVIIIIIVICRLITIIEMPCEKIQNYQKREKTKRNF